MRKDDSSSSSQRKRYTFTIYIFTLFASWCIFSFLRTGFYLQRPNTHELFKLNSSVVLGPDSSGWSNVTSSHISRQPNTREPLRLNASVVLGQVTNGCSMSSAARALAKEILEVHGYKVNDLSGSKYKGMFRKYRKFGEEILKAKNMVYIDYAHGDMNEALRIMAKDAEELNTTILVKYHTGGIEDAEEGLRDIKTRVVGMYRRNALDRHICRVRDCIDKRYQKMNPHLLHSYPVDAFSGKKSHICFRRRQANHTVVKAFLRVNNLANRLEEIGNKTEITEKIEKFLKIKNYHMVATEDLFAFEYDNSTDALDLSLQSWVKVFHSWGVTPDVPLVRRFLDTHPNHGTRTFHPSSETVYNAEEVKNALETRPELKEYLKYWTD